MSQASTLFRFMPWLLALVAWAVCAEPSRAAEGTKQPRRPNFVFILIDDLGWADLGCYGSKFYETPNIDRLAKQGMRFTDAYAAPVCSPTRASIMTGKHPARLRLTNYLVGKRWPAGSPLQPIDWQLALEQGEMTIAEALRAAGYVTGIIGKWHLGKAPPQEHGFVVNVDADHRGSPPGYFNKKDEYLTDRHTEAAEKFIEKNRDRPFFLYLAHYAVHIPLQAKKELTEKYRKKAEQQAAPEEVFGKDSGVKVRQMQNHAVYAAMIESMDRSVGRVMKKLEELGIDDHTVVIFFSDNGGLCSAEGWPTTNLPLRLGKGWLYEGGVRVPMLVRWPGVTKAGSVCRVPVISDDFFPTLLEMAGLPARPKQHQDGKSLVPLLKGGGKLDRDALFWHYPHYSNQGGPPSGAVRQGDWKLIEFYEDGRLELFNLRNDLGERENLASRMPERARELRALLDAWRRSVGAQMPPRKGG